MISKTEGEMFEKFREKVEDIELDQEKFVGYFK